MTRKYFIPLFILGQPNSHNNVEDCIEMSSTGRWKNSFCYVQRGWSCSISRGIEPNKTDSEISPDSFPSNYLIMKSYFYLFFNSKSSNLSRSLS